MKIKVKQESDGWMDKTVFEKFLGKKIQIINNENFALYGIITGVYEDYFEFVTDGKTRILSFDRIQEIRP